MECHIKIGDGSDAAPRLYFADDTRGASKKIHVGFYGPNDLVPGITR